MCFPSGEKYGFVTSPEFEVSLLATPPDEGTSHKSSSLTNTTLSSCIVGNLL
jgi:hypothetical protein